MSTTGLGPRASCLLVILLLLQFSSYQMASLSREDRTSDTFETRQDSSTEIPLEDASAMATKEKEAFLELLRLPPSQKVQKTQRRAKVYLQYDSDWTNSVQVLVSKESWTKYTKFNEETCRETNDAYIAERTLNSTENGYFSWEENVFHQELRKIILPETRDGSYTRLIGTPLLRSLDPRFFASAPESLCKAKLRDSAEDEAAMKKQEQDRFEDYLINKVLSLSHFTKPSVSSSNSTGKRARRDSLLASLLLQSEDGGTRDTFLPF